MNLNQPLQILEVTAASASPSTDNVPHHRCPHKTLHYHKTDLLCIDCPLIHDIEVNKLCGTPPQYAPPPVTLTLKVVSESRDVGYPCANFSLDLGPMYATDRRQTPSSLNAPA